MFSESWNELFPDCPIRETDLSHPTELFLTKALTSYLRSFGYDVKTPYMDTSDNSREKRMFLIKLTRQIDQILKITDKSYSFFYYDIIRPTPKKTSHLLGILLNYVYYFNMYKMDVFQMANKRIKVRQELLTEISQKQQDNVARARRSEKVKEEIERLSSEVPVKKAELEAISAKTAKVVAELKKLPDVIEEGNAKIEDLKAQKRQLGKEIVDNGEIHDLQKQFSQLNEDIDVLKRLIRSTEANLKECNESIGTLTDFIKNIDEAKEIVPANLLTSLKETIKTLNETQKQAADMESKKREMLQKIEQQRDSLKDLDEKMKILQKQSQQKKSQHSQQIAGEEQLCQSNSKAIKSLQEEEHSLECSLEEQKGIRSYLEENIAELLMPYKNTAN